MAELLTSPLHDRHLALGATFAEFGGWSMPLQYASIVAEHKAVRTGVGIFDVSHLGKVVVAGPGGASFVNSCLTNDLGRIAPGQAQYTLCCADDGGVVDDLICYLVSTDEVFCVPNAANAADVAARLRSVAPEGIAVTDRHRDFAVLAVQGPKSAAVVSAVGLPTELDYMEFRDGRVGDSWVRVCRTGYTGEHGYELIVASPAAGELWDTVMDAGEPHQIAAAGLGARDTLRTEMGYALHGHELSLTITPVQAGVTWAVGWRKPAFWGADALRAEREAGPKRRLRALRSSGRAIPRDGMTVTDADGRGVGVVTSGTYSPTLRRGIALAIVEPEVAPGDQVTIDVRGRAEVFEVVILPFVPARVR